MMSEPIRQRYARWRLDDLLVRHPGLRIVPDGGDDLVLAGTLAFRAAGLTQETIEDSYTVELRVPAGFPKQLPTARETGGRIPKTFHKLVGGLLCLGAPTAIRLELTLAPTLLQFVEGFVVPYLYGYSSFVMHGKMPFDELAHGDEGIRQYLGEMFLSPAGPGVERFVLLASKKKRDANKHLCPCRSGRRLGRCHHRQVNSLRDRLGRSWFKDEYARLADQLDFEG